MTKKEISKLEEQFNSLALGTPIYLHPVDKEELACFGYFGGIEEEEGERKIKLENSVYFTFLESKNSGKWTILSNEELTIFPLTDILDIDFNLYTGKDIFDGMQKGENYNVDFVNDVISARAYL